MKALVTGFKGQLGYDVVKHLKLQNVECCGVDIDDFDLTDKQAVCDYIEKYSPDTVVHCAAYTAVDKAEDDQDTCFKVNVDGAENIALACKKINAAMMYISTDYVFDGEGEQPFETDDVKDPKGYYGLTKSLGEDKVTSLLDRYFILRTAWVFGINGHNFVKTMLRLGKEKDELRVVADQFGSPTYTDDLAVLICSMIKTDKYGIYHATNEGFCSWCDFAVAIMAKAGLKAKVVPVGSEEYPTRAVRPHNSRLSKVKLDHNGFKRLPTWEDALERYIRELT